MKYIFMALLFSILLGCSSTTISDVLEEENLNYDRIIKTVEVKEEGQITFYTNRDGINLLFTKGDPRNRKFIFSTGYLPTNVTFNRTTVPNYLNPNGDIMYGVSSYLEVDKVTMEFNVNNSIEGSLLKTDEFIIWYVLIPDKKKLSGGKIILSSNNNVIFEERN